MPGDVIRPRRIPEATVVRLPVYQRILDELLRHDTATVSSEELASRARVNAAKVRKDFSLLGWFGTRGTGYDAAYLAGQIDRVLGADRDWPVAIVGMGNLGRALAGSEGFSSHGFRVAWLFDVAPEVVGRRVGGTTVSDMEQFEAVLDGARPAIGVIATPAVAAQRVADSLVEVGVRSILNFAPRLLTVPPGTVVRSVDLSIELQVMSFHLAQGSRTGEPAS